MCLGLWAQLISIHALREEGDLSYLEMVRGLCISIHALREEGDFTATVDGTGLVISIHALREEGDNSDMSKIDTGVQFLSTPSARRATIRTCLKLTLVFNFYPRPPRGGRQFGHV